MMSQRVLVAEDSPTQAERLRLLLEEEGYRVDVARDGRAGLEAVRATPPDLIISDILMPEMDGYAFCHAVKSSAATRRIPFVLFTERHAPMDIIEGFLRGADNFIPKSSPDEYLLARVRRIFEQLVHRRENQLSVEIIVRVGTRDIPISADKQQIFELLISSVEEAGRATDELKNAQRQLEEHARTLEQRVEARTQELSKAEKKYRALVEQIPAVVYLADPGTPGTVLYVSPQIETFLGFPAAQWLADPGFWGARIHEDDRARVAAEFGPMRAAGQPASAEYRMLARDGHVVWVRDEARFVSDGGFVQGVMLDITKRKRAEEERARLSLVVEQAVESIIVTDPEGTITYVNPAFERVAGYSREEVVGRKPSLIKSGKHDEAFYRDLWSTLVRGDTWHGCFINRRKDGTLYEEEASLFAVRDAAGKLLNYVAVKRDVTHERRLIEQLRQAQKLEAIGQLAGGVAHDFNNLLGVITGYSELALKDVGPGHPAARRVEQIRKAADRAAALTRQLLAFSRKQVLEPRILDLNAVVGDVERMLRRLIGEDIQLITVLSPGLGRVKADPGQLEQVIINLSVNARDAMAQGGKLIIETADVSLDETYTRSHAELMPGRYVVLALTDTGAGMDAETLSRLFEPFFTTKEAGKGTGLGLATVYGIVKQSGGHINVYSEPGRGSTFKVYLPRVEEPDAAAEGTERPPEESTPTGSETILLVEDAEALRLIIREVLEAGGYTVLSGGNPEEALTAAESHSGPIHLVLTDVVMPRISGREVVARVQSLRPETRALYMSGYTNEAISHHGVLDPGTRFIQKPFTSDAVLRKVREALDATGNASPEPALPALR